MEGRDLIGPDPHVAVDSYVRVFLLPDKSTNMQTRVSCSCCGCSSGGVGGGDGSSKRRNIEI